MFSLDDFLARCRDAVADPQPALAVRELLEQTMRDRAAVAAAFGTPRRAELAVLHSSDDLVVLNAVWAPSMRFPPHDHRTWAVIGIYGGDEDNAFYRRTGASITEAGGRSVHEGEVVVLGPDVIHAVTNPHGESFTGAIHVYGGPYLTAPRSMWQEPELVEGPVSFAASQRLFADANAGLDTAAATPGAFAPRRPA
jgi:predicted metal-dependent enzyme (double-stranded beta helix superfamily)